jgi:Flp pilus assembly protein TadD
VLAGGALVCAVAVASRLAPGAFPADVVKEGFSSRRLSFPLDYWNATGAWAVMSAAVSVGLGSHLPQAAPRVVTASIAPLCVTCIYLAYSRAAVVGLVVALAVLWALSRNRGTLLVHVAATAVGGALVILVIRANGAIADGTGGAGGAGGGGVALALAAAMAVAGAVALATLRAGADQRLRLAPRVARRALGVAAVCLAVAAAIFAPDLASDAWDSFNEDQHFGLSDPAQRLSNLNGNRRNLYASALDAGRAHPWAGLGPGTFEFWWSEDARDPEFVRDAHSLYLEQFAELGWPGLAAVLGLVVALLAGAAVARRRLRTGAELGASAAALAAAAAFMVQAGVDWMWESTACAVLGLVVGACGVAAAAPPAHRPRRLWRAVVALLAVAAVLAQLPPLVSLSQVRASQDAFSLGRVETALAEAEDAVEAEPWAATPYVQRGLLAESRGALGPAVADLLRAERAEPTNWRHPLLLARLLAEQGDADGAVAAYRRARALRPLSERFRQR